MNAKTLISCLFFWSLSQAAFAVNSSAMHSSIDISYGVVKSIGQEKVNSKAAQGALMGGVVGAAAGGSHNRGKHALAGALAGGIISAILQGKREAYAYDILTTDGREKMVLTEQDDIRVGDCVSIEEGKTTNIRRVPPVHCEHRQHLVMSEPMVQSKAHGDAAECHAAKSIALKASTEEEMDLALKKVQVFCD